MSTMRPKDWPVYGDPVYCVKRNGRCDRFDCVMYKPCEMELVPKETEPPSQVPSRD